MHKCDISAITGITDRRTREEACESNGVSSECGRLYRTSADSHIAMMSDGITTVTPEVEPINLSFRTNLKNILRGVDGVHYRLIK